jgi:transposase-like protein
MGQRRRFTPEFTRQAVQLLNAGQRPAAELARELGAPHNRLYKWQKEVAAHGGARFPARSDKRPGRRDRPPQTGIGSSHRGARHFKKPPRTLRGSPHEIRVPPDSGAVPSGDTALSGAIVA